MKTTNDSQSEPIAATRASGLCGRSSDLENKISHKSTASRTDRRPVSQLVACILALLTSATFLTGCDDATTNPASTRPAGPPTVSMSVGSKTYTLELAGDELSRELGLMNRDKMSADHGMIFVFPDEQDRSFWMKNTLIPLDIVFADAKGKVVSTHTMKPMDLTTTPSDGAAKYAIELNAGEDAGNGIKKGDTLMIPPAVDAALKK
jgi:uncharacterized membrane protein (UPF0127 family)